MDFVDFLEELRLDESCGRVISEGKKRLPTELFCYETFLKDNDKHLSEVERLCKEANVNLYEGMLSVVVHLSFFAYSRYKELGLSDRIFFDTFKDIAIWNRVCQKSEGVCGLKEYYWLTHHLALRLFRLGRLQFLPEACERDYMVNDTKIRSGSIVISVHIPEDGRLEYEACKNSYAEALRFFKLSHVFMCQSWLLNDKLNEFLPASSNIIRFQRDYTLFESHDSRQGEERVFFELKDDPKLYPENTSLQRGMKNFLLKGNKFGTRTGLMVL